MSEDQQAELIPVRDDIPIMAACESIAASGLCGVRTRDQAFTLMCMALADDPEAGNSPAAMFRALGIAIRTYHIIDGKPSIKTEAAMARFQNASGVVEWHEISNKAASATFTLGSTSAKITWTYEDAARAGLTGKGNWKSYPRAMLRSRCVAEGVRTVAPGVCNGVPFEDEVAILPSPPKVISVATTSDDASEANRLAELLPPEVKKAIRARCKTAPEFIKQANDYLRSVAPQAAEQQPATE